MGVIILLIMVVIVIMVVIFLKNWGEAVEASTRCVLSIHRSEAYLLSRKSHFSQLMRTQCLLL